MKLHRMELGFNGTNSYLVSDQDSTFIIDPGADGEKILAFIQEKTEVDKIILTHGHFDHIGAVAYIQEKPGQSCLYIQKIKNI